MRVVTDNAGFLLGGLLVTLELTGLGLAGALLLGTVLAVFRVSPILPLRAAGAVYVGVLPNMPLLSLLVLVVFGLPDIGLTLSLLARRHSASRPSARRSSARRCAPGSTRWRSARRRPPARSGSPPPRHCST